MSPLVSLDDSSLLNHLQGALIILQHDAELILSALDTQMNAIERDLRRIKRRKGEGFSALEGGYSNRLAGDRLPASLVFPENHVNLNIRPVEITSVGQVEFIRDEGIPVDGIARTRLNECGKARQCPDRRQLRIGFGVRNIGKSRMESPL